MTPMGRPPKPPVSERPPVVLHPHARDVIRWAFGESDKPFVVRKDEG